MSKASAYGDEIWQVDSLPQNADRMFISSNRSRGLRAGGVMDPNIPSGGSVSTTGE
jgi:hypothetical protein